MSLPLFKLPSPVKTQHSALRISHFSLLNQPFSPKPNNTKQANPFPSSPIPSPSNQHALHTLRCLGFCLKLWHIQNMSDRAPNPLDCSLDNREVILGVAGTGCSRRGGSAGRSRQGALFDLRTAIQVERIRHKSASRSIHSHEC